MDLSLAALAAEARLTLQDPRAGLRRILTMNPPMPARWMAFLLMAIGSAITTHLSFALVPVEDQDAVIGVMQSPLRTAAMQGVLLLAIVQMVHWLGRMRGGTGSFPDTLLAMVWLQFLMLGLQVIQLVLMVLLPPLAALVNLAGFAIFLWLLTNFIAELHSFRSLLAVFGGIIFGMILLGFGFAILLLILTGGAVA
jgi:hypothetical protein